MTPEQKQAYDMILNALKFHADETKSAVLKNFVVASESDFSPLRERDGRIVVIGAGDIWSANSRVQAQRVANEINRQLRERGSSHGAVQVIAQDVWRFHRAEEIAKQAKQFDDIVKEAA